MTDNQAEAAARNVLKARDAYLEAFEKFGDAPETEAAALELQTVANDSVVEIAEAYLSRSPSTPGLREALEATLPRYIELFEAAGLGNADDSIAVQLMRGALAACPSPDGEAVEAARRILDYWDVSSGRMPRAPHSQDEVAVARAYLALVAPGDRP